MRSLLIRLPNWVGDVAMASGVLKAVRERLPQARITWVCRPYASGLLEAMSWKDEVVLEDAGRLGLVRRLRQGAFDAALLFPASFGSAFEAWAAAIPRRVGLDVNGRGLLLTDRVEPFREAGSVVPVYMGRLYARLAGALLGAEIPVSGPCLIPTGAARERAGALWIQLGLGGKRVVALVPGASYGSAKCWPGAHFAALVRLLKDAALTPVLLHGPGEEALVSSIGRQDLIVLGPDRVGLDLLPAVLGLASAVVTNDTGPRHVAEAAGVPTVVLLGPMDRRYTESGHSRVRVLQEAVDCHPCNLRVCPIDHRCLERLSPERVLAEVLDALR